MFAPKKIEAVVKNVADREERCRNVILYGIQEKAEENLKEEVENVLIEIGEKPVVKDCTRVGQKRDDVPRPVKFTLSSTDHVSQVLRNAKRLRTKEGFKSVYLSPDRTVNERKAHKKLLEQLAEKRRSEPTKSHYIKNNKVFSSDVN